MKAKFLFGDIVVVDDDLIGVIVKTWENIDTNEIYYSVYVRQTNSIINYNEKRIERYAIRHKYLNDEELKYQNEYKQRGNF